MGGLPLSNRRRYLIWIYWKLLLSYKFQNRGTARASGHPSILAHEQVAPGAEDEARRLHNESLEFLEIRCWDLYG